MNRAGLVPLSKMPSENWRAPQKLRGSSHNRERDKATVEIRSNQSGGCLPYFSALVSAVIVVITIFALKLLEKVFLNGLADQVKERLTPETFVILIVISAAGLLVAVGACRKNASLQKECAKVVVGAFIVLALMLVVAPEVLPGLAQHLPDIETLVILLKGPPATQIPILAATLIPSPIPIALPSSTPEPTNVCMNVPAPTILGHFAGADHQVKKDETLTSIAILHGTTVKELREANKEVHPQVNEFPDCLWEGIWLDIPGKDSD